MEWIIGLLVSGLVAAVLVALLFRWMFIASLRAEAPGAGTRPARTALIAVSKFELMEEEKSRAALAGHNERDPLVCAVLSLLHAAKADAAAESNDPKNPEWLANRFTGALHGLLQFEAELKEALSAVQVAEKEEAEKL
jgi:hypothetical protein